MNQTNYLQSYIFDKQTGWRIDLPSYIAPGTRVLCLYRVSTGKQLYHNEQNQADIVAMVFFSAVFAARAPAMGTARTELGSSHGSWKGSLLLSTPAHGSLSCVKTNSVSFASTQARKRKIRSLLRRGRRARRARFPTCGVIRVAGYSVVWDCGPTPIFPLKSTKRSAAAISRPQRSFIAFYGALRIILLSAELSATIRMITPEQTFVNDSLQKIFLADAASGSNRFYP